MTASRAYSDDVIAQLDATAEIIKLRERIDRWLAQVDPELRDSLTWALRGHAQALPAAHAVRV